MSGDNDSTQRLESLRTSTAQSSNAGTVSAIATTGHVASAGLIASGGYAAFSSGGMTALCCFAGRVAVPIAGAMAGAWVAEKVHADDWVLRQAEHFGAQRLAGPSNRAAHLRHQIAHSNAFVSLLAGIAVGIVVGIAATLALGAIVATAGLAGPLIGAAVAFGGAAVGGFVTSAIAGAGAKSATMCGPISSGSPNVFFEGQPVARVSDTAACTRHPSPTGARIIEGSLTIAVNGLPLARIGHKLSCNAVVQQGCDTIFGDDTTGSFGTPDAEFSVWQQLLLSAFEVAGSRSGTRKGGLLDGLLRRLFGEPVDIVTGDYADTRVDFEYPGILPLRLARTYPGRMHVEGALGPRWICNWSQRLVFDPEASTALLEDAEGQRLLFALGEGPQIVATHLKAPYYRLTGTRERLRLYDSRTQQFLVFVCGADGVGRVAAIEDRNGNRIVFGYDSRDHLRTIEHSDGTSFRVETTSEGWLRSLAMVGEALPLVRYDYDEAGGLTRALGAFSGEFHYRYTREGWLSGWRDSGPTQVEIAYDEAGRVVATRTGDGMFNDRFLYFPEERLSRYVDANGAVRSFWYDDNGLVTCEEDPLGHRIVHEYDGLERLQRRIDAAGRATVFAYDGDGRMTARTDWAGRSTQWSYDRWGALTSSTAPDGQSSEWRYDARGNAVAWSNVDGLTGEADHDDRGAIVRERDIGGGTTQWERDAAGRPLARHDPAKRTERYAWDRFGRLTAATDAAGRITAFRYDRGAANPRGALSRTIRADGSERRITYDSEGLLATQVRGDGQTTTYVHGAFDTLRRVIDPLGATTQFVYDGTGQLVEVTDAAGQKWRFRYDAGGWLEAQSDWAGRETAYRRDVLGRVFAKRMPDGDEQQFVWDERDRITRVTAGEDVIAYRYDDADRLVGASTQRLVDGTLRTLADTVLHYDGQGRLSGEEQNGLAVVYRYDASGRCIGRSSPSGETALAFDDAGLLQRYDSNGHSLRFSYDASGLETLREATALGARTAFQLRQRYDPCGRLQEQRAGGVAVFGTGAEAGAQPSAFARRYDWDRAGRLAGVVDGTGEQTRYRYDARDQVLAVERAGHGETYRYDALMNLAEGLAGDHRYWRDCVVQAGGNRFRYDVRGRMVERTATVDGFRPRRWSYHWDGFDRLVGLETPDGERWRYGYDAFGRRMRKERLDGPARRVDYVWQGEVLAEAWARGGDEDGPSRLQVERWHYAADGLRPIAKERVAAAGDVDPAAVESEWLPVVADQIGTPCALFGADGEQRWQGDQTLWGRARAAREVLRAKESASDDVSCALRFPGQWEDAESGLHYNLNRYYDPETGQYLSPDPIGLDGGARTHGYVHDPVQWIDPAGLANCRSNWGEWFGRKTGTQPSNGMPDPHAHHIVFKGAFARSPKMQAVLGRSRAVMSKYGIDPVNDPDALMWAPNEGHSVTNARSVATRLEAADTRISQQNLPPSEATRQMKVDLQQAGKDVFGWP